ncbi:hypothetical protein FPV67DRAFT_1415200 [Lyophyllum atratum]|nr:hypothetical protein FPV67DRAFT_1415200 [Lyophyllum atratum]
MTNSTTTPVVPSEVGWQFVPQYYTFVNKQPDRLHCFYTKSSTFIHGTEGEDGKPCFGQQEIHNKITSIGFQDCKVFIHSVDAQSSANGGIIIQVIGEMSNHGEPWRKFVQTFFLAEQPNGYFVLNDIFRFLKEETIESDDASDTADVEAPAAPTEAAPSSPAPPAPESVFETPCEPTLPPAPVAAPAVAAPPPAAEEAPAPAPDVPEPPVARPPTPAPEPAQPEPTPAPNGIHTPAPVEAEKPATPAPAPAQEKAPTPTPAHAPTPSKPATPAPAPAAPKTWASLAASNSNKWGAAVAQESRGITVENPSSPATPSPLPAPTGTQTPPRPPHPPHQPQGGPAQITTPHCFIKGVTEPLSQSLLLTTLTSRFGPIKDLEIVRSKACAFLEFASVEGARRAIAASPVWVEVPGGEVGSVRILVETKKERGERPVSRPRGGAPGAGGERGGYRGRGAPRGRGAGVGPK